MQIQIETSRVTHEEAIDILQETEVRESTDFGYATVVSGSHPKHGAISVCVSTVGDSFFTVVRQE